MSSSPRELIDCASQLLDGASAEPHYRAVCSRAYYAAYHAANEFHHSPPAPGSVGAARGRHEQLIAQLGNPQISKQNGKFRISQAMSKTLRLLIDARVRADYHMNLDIDQTLASKTASNARVIIEASGTG
jgi:uncharacterized protein (UPF0332 family)